MNQLGRSFSRAATAAPLVVSVLGGALALASCDDTSNTITLQLNLDRPVDVAFTCYGGLRLTKPGVAGVGTPSDEIVTSPQPLASCDLRALERVADTTAALPKGQEDLTANGGAAMDPAAYFGLIVQSGPGTVALAQFPANPRTSFNGADVAVLDADPLIPGKTSIAVGASPIAIATDPSGCFAVTANAGSCDLSSLDIASAFKFDGQATVERVAVTNKSNAAINARPAAMLASPGLTYPQVIAPATDAERIGQTCPAKPQGYLYVAYPSCHTVAVINAATGQIEKGIQFAADGTASVVDGAAVTCADECDGQIITPTAAPEPVTLDLINDVVRVPEAAAPSASDMRPISRRLAIGARNSNSVYVVDLDASYLPVAAAPLKVDLEQSASNNLGVLDISLTPTIGMGGQPMPIPADSHNTIKESGDVFQFVYAVATDGTIRVANVLSSAPGGAHECDTRIDSRKIPETDFNMAKLSCMPLAPANRRQGSIGPGIPEPVRGAFSAVSTFRVQATVGDERTAGPARLVGYFGVATSTSGLTYIIDIDDDDKQDFPANLVDFNVDLSTTLPHQVRDQVAKRSAIAESSTDGAAPVALCNSGGSGVDEAGNSSGGARLAGAFNRLNQTSVIAKTKELTLPNVRQLSCTGSDTPNGPVAVPEVSANAPVAVRKAVYPDTQSLLPSEDWRIVWEGVLSGDNLAQDIDGLSVRRAPVTAVGQTLVVKDLSRPYCAAGVEPFDTLQLRGCDPTSTIVQCPTGTRCYLHPDAATGQGQCLPEKNINALSELCRDFLVSARRYNIGDATEVLAGQLTLHPRMRALRSTPLEGCDSTAQCKILADYEAQQVLEGNPKDIAATVNSRTFECKPDPKRREGAKNLCIMTCQRDSDCDVASACVDGTCMEGTIPDQQCISELQRYDLRASDAFVVIGTSQTLDVFHYAGSSGYQHPIVAEGPNGQCVNKQVNTPLKIGRIPLDPPACASNPTANPCTEMVNHMEAHSTFDDTCTATSTQFVERLTPSIFFRNAGMAFHFVNPTYPGDKLCAGDRLGIPGIPPDTKRVPTVFTGFAFTFRQAGGYFPQFVRTPAVVPVRVVRGPQQSFWVVDEGDYLTENAAVPSTRGKVFRIESWALTTVNTMQ